MWPVRLWWIISSSHGVKASFRSATQTNFAAPESKVLTLNGDFVEVSESSSFLSKRFMIVLLSALRWLNNVHPLKIKSLVHVKTPLQKP
ncbi:hypothetical protein VTL71DRAFT_14465 [Oculimacula yallundae]|uniref:Secreted protein n=1 Tax=Oculimacula yallundae TaxID=86028 RepID=A0ABR4CJW1_9HELO